MPETLTLNVPRSALQHMTQVPTGNASEDKEPLLMPVMDFGGEGTPTGNAANDDANDDGEALVMPTTDWQQLAAKR